MVFNGVKEKFQCVFELMKVLGGFVLCVDNFFDDFVQIDELIQYQDDFIEFYKWVFVVFFKCVKVVKGDEFDFIFFEEVIDLRNGVKKLFEKFKIDYFMRSFEQYLKSLVDMKFVIEMFVWFVISYGKWFEVVKQEKLIIDFFDLEYYCLFILIVENEIGECELSEVVRFY